ncbi:hypothetical protein OG2516_12421 [Oceanicola granulosus HTCC2516]|uniref:Uncharacterized protein n=1 Tax=Oceanicola granulosus (strain ATCC BAA-861 / DSM 15982 / KCTC 12143 / HTCC2516) TaxID=314256 RepID=Q2CAK3_OCEGH|nr:hypothetical protein [Oceanicola granulosus]EAR49710.1 hypothetical protein OG2516_12421 [Oceanicola granulosus HTCC2516]
MRRALASALALAALPGLALAAPFDGTYRQAAGADCADVGVEGGALKIEDGIFHGVGMECRMTQPVNVLEMDAILYTMECSNDDDVWTERVMVMSDGETDGIYMIWDGYAFRYQSCDAPDAEATGAEEGDVAEIVEDDDA